MLTREAIGRIRERQPGGIASAHAAPSATSTIVRTFRRLRSRRRSLSLARAMRPWRNDNFSGFRMIHRRRQTGVPRPSDRYFRKSIDELDLPGQNLRSSGLQVEPFGAVDFWK
jgi:hypothetical protein